MGSFGCYGYLSDQDYLGFNPLMRYLGQKLFKLGWTMNVLIFGPFLSFLSTCDPFAESHLKIMLLEARAATGWGSSLKARP